MKSLVPENTSNKKIFSDLFSLFGGSGNVHCFIIFFLLRYPFLSPKFTVYFLSSQRQEIHLIQTDQYFEIGLEQGCHVHILRCNMGFDSIISDRNKRSHFIILNIIEYVIHKRQEGQLIYLKKNNEFDASYILKTNI